MAVAHERITPWDLRKFSPTPWLEDPDSTAMSYVVTVTEGATRRIFSQTQSISITNSGSAPAYIASFVLNLQRKPRKGVWTTFASAIADRRLVARTTVPTCFGNITASPAVTGVVITDADSNDVIALGDVPQIAPGATKTFSVTVSFDAAALGLFAGEDLRSEILTTFEGAGPRGNSGDFVSCTIDADGDGQATDSRTIAVRNSTSVPALTVINGTVHLADSIRVASDALIASVTDFLMSGFTLLLDGSNAFTADVAATGTTGTETSLEAVASATCNPDNVDGGTTGVTNGATLEGDAPGYISGSPALADIGIYCSPTAPPAGIVAGDFRTYTQGGWGAKCAGKNPGCTRDAGFATALPSGLRAGDTKSDGASGGYSAQWTTAAAIDKYLPAGSTPGKLTADLLNPQSTSAGVLGGQLVAATLNVEFDRAGLLAKANTAVLLADLVYQGGGSDPLSGLTVAQILAEANGAISGLSSPYSYSQLNNALTHINENFDNGSVNGGYLFLP